MWIIREIRIRAVVVAGTRAYFSGQTLMSGNDFYDLAHLRNGRGKHVEATDTVEKLLDRRLREMRLRQINAFLSGVRR